jgi:outer membrane lipoprotein SlyB
MSADAQPVTGGTVERREVVDRAGNAKGKAAQGAVAGAILGRVLGGDTKGTVVGAAGGAAAGAALGRSRTHEESCFTPGAEVRMRLKEALAVR